MKRPVAGWAEPVMGPEIVAGSRVWLVGLDDVEGVGEVRP